MKTTRTKIFDAVAESRRWKAAVSRETAAMTPEQVMAFFNKDRVIAALGALQPADGPRSIVREDTPEHE